MERNEKEQQQIDEMVKLLDSFADSEGGRLKIEISDQVPEGEKKRAYHLGRCDIGSPWACGNAFDAQTEK